MGFARATRACVLRERNLLLGVSEGDLMDFSWGLGFGLEVGDWGRFVE